MKTTIIIHCLDTRGDQDVGVEEVRRWHVEENGWTDIGYAYLIRRSAEIELGRDLDGDGDVDDEVGAHAYGFNRESIGIAIAGGMPNFNFTWDQLKTLRQLVLDICSRHPTIERVIGHNDVSSKACPMFDVHYLLADIIPKPKEATR